MITDLNARRLLHWATILRDTHDDGQIDARQYEALCKLIAECEAQIAPAATPPGMLDARGNVT